MSEVKYSKEHEMEHLLGLLGLLEGYHLKNQKLLQHIHWQHSFLE